MRQLGERQLWVGNAGDLRDARRVLDAGIEAVVELADSEPLAALPRHLVRLRFPMSDGGDNPVWLLRLAVGSVRALLMQRIPTLVCCSAGMSRSVSVAAAAVATAEQRRFGEVLAEIAGDGPADVCPGLLHALMESMSIPKQ